MKILGVDPGSRVTGLGLISGSGSSYRVGFAEAINLHSKESLAKRLGRLVDRFEAILDQMSPDVVVFESAFRGKSSRSLIVLAQARGALLAAAGRKHFEIAEYSPAEVKSAVAGHGRADKEQVQRMVRLQLAYREPMKDDVADALAVAFCFALRAKMDRLIKP